MVLTEILKENAQKFPDVIALTMKIGFRTLNLTYKDVYDKSLKIALLLQKEGLKKGDKVLLLAPNSPYWICTFWGCLLAGVIVVPLNIQSTPELVEKISKQTEAKLFFGHRFYRPASPNNLKRFDLDFINQELEQFDPKNFSPININDDDLVEILYTSGTTGDPKGVMLTHKNLYSNISAVEKIVNLKYCQDRILSILPLSHIFEQLAGFLLAYHYGSQIIYAHSYAAIGELLKEYKITKMAAVPEFLKIMMNKIESAAEEKGKKKIFDKLMKLSLKISRKLFSRILFYPVNKKFGGKLDTIVCGGAPLDIELEKKWNGLGIDLLQGYGLTETSPLVTANSYKDHKFGSVGKVVPGVQVKISQDGEICVKGDNVFAGYFKDEEKTKAVISPDGWFKTEDMGNIDEDGFLFIKGRKKYIILGPGGQNVFPEDIESVLNNFPRVLDSCVVGVETEAGMMQIHAVLLLKDFDDSVAQAIVEKANEKLASYQKITAVSIWPDEDFPRSATKKVKKDEVLKFLADKKEQKEGFVFSRKKPLISLLSQITGIEASKINLETKLEELQIDSLMRIELIARVEEKFGVLLDETELVGQKKVSDVEKMIKEKKPIKTLPPLRKWPRWKIISILRFIKLEFLFLFMKLFVKLKVNGLENLKDLKLPVVFMPNHISYLDSFVFVAALPRKMRRLAFAAANDVLYGEFKYFAPFGEFLFNTFPFPRKEGENIKLGLDYMGKLLDKNFSIVVFPEGKMSVDGKLLPLKKGAGLVAVEMGEYVIPVKIDGSDYVLPYAKMIPRRRGTVTVTFGRPLKFKPTDSYVKVTEVIEVEMRNVPR